MLKKSGHLILLSLILAASFSLQFCSDDSGGGSGKKGYNFKADTVINDNTGAEYPTIEEALDEAEEGHLILIGTGTYNPPLLELDGNFNGISLIGAGRDKVILDRSSGEGENGIEVTGMDINLKGFTVKNSAKAAFDLNGVSNIVIENAATENNGSVGIYIHGDTDNIKIENSIFKGEKYAIEFEDGNFTNIIVQNNEFNDLKGYVNEDGDSFSTYHIYLKAPDSDQINLDLIKNSNIFNAPVKLETEGGIESIVSYFEYEVYHLQGGDEKTTCRPFADCLETIKDWSDEHSGHLPILVWIEIKDDWGGEKINSIQPIDKILKHVFGDKLYTPDHLKDESESDSVRDALTDGWPYVGELKDRVIFMILNSDNYIDDYTYGRTSLDGRAMFLSSRGHDDYTQPWEAVAKINNPSSSRIPGALASNILVASNICMAGTYYGDEDRPAECNAKFQAGKDNGVNMLKDDFPADVGLDPLYWMDMTNICNSVTYDNCGDEGFTLAYIENSTDYDEEIRLNHLRLKGTHNSYHIKPGENVFIRDWRYTHLPLDEQLSYQGVRVFELDLHLEYLD